MKNVYIVLAKIGLWLAATTLVGIVIVGGAAALRGNTEIALPVVQACQALSVIAITVLGYHHYREKPPGTSVHWHEVAYQPPADDRGKANDAQQS